MIYWINKYHAIEKKLLTVDEGREAK